MDALSALKMVSPTMGDSLLNQAQGAGASILNQTQGAGAAPKISVADLDKLSPGIAAQPLSGGQPAYSFENLLGNFVNDVSAQQTAGANSVNSLLSGKNTSLHQTMISMEEASVSFQMMVEVRNKVLDSYQELMRMSI